MSVAMELVNGDEMKLLLERRPPAEAQLTLKILEMQRRMDLSDPKFAELLGVTQALWLRTRKGELPLGMAVLAGAYQAFKILRPEVDIFLRSIDLKGSRQGRRGTVTQTGGSSDGASFDDPED